MAKIYQGERLVSMNSTHRFLVPILGPVERFLYRLSGIDPRSEIEKYAEGRQFGIFGEPRVNVLLLNLALDGIQ